MRKSSCTRADGLDAHTYVEGLGIQADSPAVTPRQGSPRHRGAVVA